MTREISPLPESISILSPPPMDKKHAGSWPSSNKSIRMQQPMIVHVFNSSSVSGPERLVLPALAPYRRSVSIVNLVEQRIGRLREVDPLENYCTSLNLSYRA